MNRIRRTVSAHPEISRLTDAESESPQGGKALYLEKVAGSPFPAATNRFASPRRMPSPAVLPVASREEPEELLTEMIPGVVGLRVFPEDSALVPEGTGLLMIKVLQPGDRAGKDDAQQILACEARAAFRVILLHDADIDLEDHSLVLWKLVNSTNPGRNIHFESDRCVVDACRKDASDGHLREWPEELAFDV